MPHLTPGAERSPPLGQRLKAASWPSGEPTLASLGYTPTAMATESDDLTQLLAAWADGDSAALDRLIPLVYDDLHRMARSFFQREPGTHTLQPTALVSEVYLRLRGRREMRWDNRADFFHFAAEVMRHFLVDYARRRKADKRGGDQIRIPLDTSLGLASEAELDLVDLHRALEQLAEIDPRQSQIVNLRFFVGLKVEEVAEILGISKATVKREWRTAKFWLRRHLEDPSPRPESPV